MLLSPETAGANPTQQTLGLYGVCSPTRPRGGPSSGEGPDRISVKRPGVAVRK